MIVSFNDEGTEDIFNGQNSKAARKTCPESLWKVAARKLDQLDSATTLADLRVPPGQQSIRINEQYRLCFVWTASGPGRVEIVDYH